MRITRSGLLLAVGAALFVAVIAAPSPRVQHARATGALTFNSCNDSQKAVVQQAFTDAAVYADDAVAYFDKNKAGNRFTNWFGAFDLSRRATASGYARALKDALALLTPASGDCSGTGCDVGVYAFVYPTETATHPIHLCDQFWLSPATGQDSRAGTLVHEFSHFVNVAVTNDYVYGQSAAHNLALSQPENAVKNADNYEYFFENTPVIPDNAPAYTYSVSSADFGSHDVGTTEFSRVVTITNWGDTPLNVTTVSASGDFQVSGSCANSTIASLSSCAVTLTFAPTTTGARTGALSVMTDARVAPASVTLTGTATAVPVVTTTVPSSTTTTSTTTTTTTVAPTTTVPVTTTQPIVETTTTTSSTSTVPVRETLKVRAASVSRSSRLRITVTASSGAGRTTFTVQKKSGKSWKRVGGPRTPGANGTLTIDLPRGTYRAVITADVMHTAAISNSVALLR